MGLFLAMSSRNYIFIYRYNGTHAEYLLATHLDLATGQPTAVVLKFSGYTSTVHTNLIFFVPCISVKFNEVTN
jgi:hypothetical protein